MLRPMPIGPLPPETARVAHAAFPTGHRDRRVADALETLFTADAFLALFPTHGPPAQPPWPWALVTLLPDADGLSDRQAAPAVRRRIEWNYVLRLERTEPGFDASVLSACRPRLLAGAAEYRLVETLLSWCRDHQLVKARGRQRTDSTPILAAVRALTRLDVVGETMRHALKTLAVVAPEWLGAVSPPDGQDRDARRAADDRLPTTHAARAALALPIGPDGGRWLAAVEHVETPARRREVPAVATLRRVWSHKSQCDGTQRHGREADHIPPAAQFLSSPSDPDAHAALQPTPPWVGDQVPRTATCADALPHLITQVEPTLGASADGAAPPKIHRALQRRGVLPGTHLVDPGCLDAELLVESRDDDGVDLLGPARLDDHGQAREGAGCDAQHFQSAWEREQAPCPVGTTRTGWTPAVDNRGHAVITVKFSTKDERRGAKLSPWVRSQKRYPRRTLSIRPQPPYQALQTARPREATDALQAEYARRARSEGTLSRGPRAVRLRRTRAIGLRRGHLGPILAAVGLTVRRLGAWFLEIARARTRLTPFARRMAESAAASPDETSPAVSKVRKSQEVLAMCVLLHPPRTPPTLLLAASRSDDRPRPLVLIPPAR